MNQLGGASQWEGTGGSPGSAETPPVSGEAGLTGTGAHCEGEGLGENFLCGLSLSHLGSERGIAFSLRW